MTPLTLRERLRLAIGASHGCVWLRTDEPDEALSTLFTLTNAKNWRLLTWDCDRGLDDGTGKKPNEGGPMAAMGQSPTASLQAAIKLLEGLDNREDKNRPDSERVPTVLVVCNLQRFIDNPLLIQIVQNFAKTGKNQYKLLVGMTHAGGKLPPELVQVFSTIEHELPDAPILKKIAAGLAEGASIDVADELLLQTAASGAGLTRWQFENAVAESVALDNKVEPGRVWNYKANVLDAEGLVSVYRGDDGFDTLGGLHGVKDFCMRMIGSKAARARARGIMLVGPPGTGKSQFAKCLGNAVQRPTVLVDLGRLMGGLVGDTERNTRRLITLLDAMAPCVAFFDEMDKMLPSVGEGGHDSGVSQRMVGSLLTWLNDHTSEVFVVGTANDVSRLHEAFLRSERFDGTFYVPLPDEAQREAIWTIYRKHFDIKDAVLPPAANWTGAEIRACCRLAHMMGIPLRKAAMHVVAVAVSRGKEVEQIKLWARHRCLDANTGQPVTDETERETPATNRRRRINTSAMTD